MKVGFVGLGKLGLPVALAVESCGHEVVGFDVDPAVAGYVRQRRIPYTEQGVPELLALTELTVVDDIAALDGCDIVLVAVQTPHQPEYEGVTPLPDGRADFDYSHLTAACGALFDVLTQPTVVGVISTVLPGTVDRLIRPLCNENVRLVYTPQFIAMGTTVENFLHPEFTLIGVDDPRAADVVDEFFRNMTDCPTYRTTIANAEAIKVFYNTFITAKTVLGNLWGEMAEKLGLDADEIVDALSMADRRLISPAYLRAGVGDGGGCHPRDNIALSWLARELDVSFDFFEALMTARERHMGWLAEETVRTAKDRGLPVVVFGAAFKPGTNITTGSAARLVVNQIEAAGVDVRVYDPHCKVGTVPPWQPPHPMGVYLIATDHGDWPPVPAGSTVIDPFGSYPDVPSVTVRRIGRQ